MFRVDARLISLGLAVFFSLTASAQDGTDSCKAGDISVATFNIQFLGHFKNKENPLIAQLLKGYDLVFVQELVGPPYAGIFPKQKPSDKDEFFKIDLEARAFFESMRAQGFRAILSEEDTGSGTIIHTNSTGTEWWVAFYRPQRVDSPCRAPLDPGSQLNAQADALRNCNLPNGFLGEPRADHEHYERVPYAFAFRFGGKNDAIFISTHLQPGTSRSDRKRRSEELAAINAWVKKQEASSGERDFIILGDMNIKDCKELEAVTPASFISLNKACEKTNTTPRTDRPYDHVMYRPTTTGADLDEGFGMRRVNLIEVSEKLWKRRHMKFPGNPYRHNRFRTRLSDHHYLKFCLRVREDDD